MFYNGQTPRLQTDTLTGRADGTATQELQIACVLVTARWEINMGGMAVLRGLRALMSLLQGDADCPAGAQNRRARLAFSRRSHNTALDSELPDQWLRSQFARVDPEWMILADNRLAFAAAVSAGGAGNEAARWRPTTGCSNSPGSLACRMATPTICPVAYWPLSCSGTGRLNWDAWRHEHSPAVSMHNGCVYVPRLPTPDLCRSTLEATCGCDAAPASRMFLRPL